MPSPAELDAYQQAQVGLVTLASDALRGFWADLDLDDATGTRDALLDFLPLVTTEYGIAAAGMAGDWYDDLRATESAAQSAFAAVLAATLPTEQVQAQVRYAAGHLFTDHPEGMLVNLLNVLGSDVLQPGWDTIVSSTAADPDAYGWHRETRSSQSYDSGCGFCQMLEGRGGVYKRSTATFKSHYKCRCVAYPSWDADAEEVPSEAYVASSRTITDRDRQRTYAWINANTDVERRR